MAPATASAPSLPCRSLCRQSSAIRTGCANERPSGSARGVPRERYPYRDLVLKVIPQRPLAHPRTQTSARMRAVKRRTVLQALPAATLLPASLWAASQQDNSNPTQATTGVYELRVYHAARGKLRDLQARFREHTIKIFDRHGMKSVAYWPPLDE